MSPDYVRLLDDDPRIRMTVEFTSKGREVIDYAIVLIFESGETAATIRVYDGAHGHNEMHRYTASGGNSGERDSTAVPLEKECVARSKRSKVAIAR